MKYNGIIKKSRTLDAAALTAMAGAALVALPQLQNIVSPEHYGYAFVGLSVLNAFLRSKTTTAIGDKNV